MTLYRLNHAIAFVFGGYQDYEKFYTPSLLDEDGGLFVAIMERLAERKEAFLPDDNNNNNEVATNRGDNSAEESDNRQEQTNNKNLNNERDERNNDPCEQTPVSEQATTHDDAAPVEVPAPSSSPGNGDDDEVETNENQPHAMKDLPRPSIVSRYESAETTTLRMTGEDVNPIRLASAHVELKKLQGHKFNIFESAFFFGPEGDRGEYLLNNIQVIVAYLGCLYLFYFLGNEINRTYRNRNDVFFRDDDGDDKEFLGILVINAIGLGYFFFILGRDIDRVQTFNRCMRKLCPYDNNSSDSVKSHRWWSLFHNHFVNIIMGYGLFVLNFFFVQSVDDMVEAILNAIAVIFIVQLDDVIPPYTKTDRTLYFLNIPNFPYEPRYFLDWENSSIHGKLMDIVEEYLSHPDGLLSEVTVKKMNGESAVFCETDVCYFFVNKAEKVIRIFQGRIPDNSRGVYKYTHMYEEITYEVTGKGADDFLDTMAKFQCVEEEQGPVKLKVDDYNLQVVHGKKNSSSNINNDNESTNRSPETSARRRRIKAIWEVMRHP